MRKGCRVDGRAESDDREHHDADRQRMAKRDRDQRDQHYAPALAIEPERRGKEPAHGWIEPVKGAERDQDQPGVKVMHAGAP